MMVSSRPKGDQTWLSKTCFNIFFYNIFPHCSIILTHAYKFLWAPKKDFTPLCSKNSRQKKNCSSEKKICSSEKKSCSSEKKSCSSDFLPTVFSTSSKKKVAVAKKKVAVAKKKVAVAKKDFTMRKNVAQSYMLYGKGFQNGLF